MTRNQRWESDENVYFAAQVAGEFALAVVGGWDNIQPAPPEQMDEYDSKTDVSLVDSDLCRDTSAESGFGREQ